MSRWMPERAEASGKEVSKFTGVKPTPPLFNSPLKRTGPIKHFKWVWDKAL